ncbi:unnamed protein product [Alternaria alternata]
MPQYLVRLAQAHETFRKVELQALADIAGVPLQFVKYEEDSPYCIVDLPSDAAARRVIARSILAQGIYELWGQGSTYDALHDSVRSLTTSWWPQYITASFRFTIEGYRGSRSNDEQRDIIDSFSYMAFKGTPQMRNPDVAFRVFEDYDLNCKTPKYLYFGRFIAESCRNEAKKTFDLKKRHYISTTSMDAELTLLTANIAHHALTSEQWCLEVTSTAAPSAALEEAQGGQTGKYDVVGNFKQYDMESSYLGAFVSDLTNTPLRIPPPEKGITTGYLDGIVCDPPYGIREGLKVLGSRQALLDVERQSHQDQFKEPGYIPPKRPYSFTALLDDILAFAVATLVEDGRISMWMPTANDEDIELIIPSHPCLELTSVCVQAFNKWSRRLLTYRRRRDSEGA